LQSCYGLKLVERGPETEAVVDVLKVDQKWIKNIHMILSYRSGVDDALEAARGLILTAEGPCVVSFRFRHT